MTIDSFSKNPLDRAKAATNGGRVSPRLSGQKAATKNLICVIDDDESMCRALVDLLGSVGFEAREFGSAAEILGGSILEDAGCFVVDIRMPGVSGLDFQTHLQRSGVHAPIIFMTGHADVPMTVQAMKAGAFDFLTKPFREQEMLDAVARAVALNAARIEKQQQASDILLRFESLSAREREVMTLVTAGLMNKQAAAEIDVALSTVKTHRTQIMKKMGAKSLADLVRMAQLLQLRAPSGG